MNQDDVVRMAREAGLHKMVRVKHVVDKVYEIPSEKLERFAVLVAANERSIISETFWSAINDCITTDELGIEFMSKFYQVHEFGHWLDGENK